MGKRRTAEQLEEAAAKLRAEAAEKRKRVAAMEALDLAFKAVKAGEWIAAGEALDECRAIALGERVVT